MPSRLLVGLLLGLSAVWIALQYKPDGIFILIDAIKSLFMFIMAPPIIVMIMVSHDVHVLTPEGILVGVLTGAIEVGLFMVLGLFLRRIYRRQMFIP